MLLFDFEMRPMRGLLPTRSFEDFTLVILAREDNQATILS
jgi:hypothetical protein